MLSNFTSTPKPDPCRVRIDKVADESINAFVITRVCSGIDPTDYCEKIAVVQLAFAGVSCFLVTVGALGVFLF